MHCHQLIYTASEVSRSERPGFGIRAVSEGFPDYLYPLVNGRMTSYQSGAFETIPGNKLAEMPERILEYPRAYFFTTAKLDNGKKVYFLGRAVATGFDYPYYKTGNPSTRTGNYVSHIFIFENEPDTSIFDTLFESPLPGQQSFVPTNLLPTTSNDELKALMLGTAQPIPAIDGGFSSSVKGVPDISLDLLFDLVSALTEGKRMVIKMDASAAPAACAGLMRLLPKKYALEMSFVINHQDEGIPEGTRLTFINQYYQYPTPSGHIRAVDYLINPHPATLIEKKWRWQIADAIGHDDFERAVIIVSWLFNRLSTRMMDQSDELNWSLIRYLYLPDDFTLGEIAEVDGLLPVLSKIIAADPPKSVLLTNLLTREFEEAQSVAEIIHLMTLCERVASSGISVQEVYDGVSHHITEFALSSPAALYGLIQFHPVPVLRKYLDLSRTEGNKEFLSCELFLDKWEQVYSLFYQAPFPVRDIMTRMQSLRLEEGQIKSVLAEICPKAEDRVHLYITCLKEHPEELGSFLPYLEWDKIASEKIDYATELSGLLDREEYAPLFLKGMEYRKDIMSPVDTLRLCEVISGRNAAFRELLSNNTTIYAALFEQVVGKIKDGTLSSFKSQVDIESSVLPLIAEDNPARKGWSNLRDIYSLSIPNKMWPESCYNLALEISEADYIRAIAPRGFAQFETLDEIVCFVDALTDIAGFSSEEIVASAASVGRSITRAYYIVALAKKNHLSFDKVMALADALSIQDRNGFYSEFFKKQYRIYKFKNFLIMRKTLTLLFFLLCSVSAHASESFSRSAEHTVFAAFLMLVAAVSIAGIIFFGRRAYKKYGGAGAKWYDVFFLGTERENGMKRIWVFNPNAYLTFAGISGVIAGSFLAVFLLFLFCACIVFLFFYIIGGLIWLFTVLICILAIIFILRLIGRISGRSNSVFVLPLFFIKGLFKMANNMFQRGRDAFDTLNPFEFCFDIVADYWDIALVVAFAPFVIFLVIALSWLFIAGMSSLFESIVLAWYNVKYPCPNCGLPSEPAQYVIDRNPDGSPNVLPVHLKPGVYGIFSLRAPHNGRKLPTLFLNGKDKLERICPHCQTSIRSDLGQEKHIAVAGVSQSGKTTLLYRIAAELERHYGASITDNMGVNHAVIDRFIDKINDGSEIQEFPAKTSGTRHRSIQMILPRKDASIPYKLYLNDLAGEMFTAENNKPEDAPFFRNTDVILFLIDPMTMRTSDLEFGADFSEWYATHVGNQSYAYGKIDLEDALVVMKNTIEKHRSRKSDIRDIPVMMILPKVDAGYLDHNESFGSEAIKEYLQNEMGLDSFIFRAETYFSDISYYAVSAKCDVRDEYSGIPTLLRDVLRKLNIENR